MISVYDVKTLLKNKKDDTTFPFYEMNGKIYDKGDDKEICDLDFYVDYLRKELHCSFETVYYNHGSLTEILRCTEFGFTDNVVFHESSVFKFSKTYVNGSMTDTIETIRHYIMTKPHTIDLTWTKRYKPDWWDA